MSTGKLHEFSLDRMARAVEKVRERLLRVAAALEAAGIPSAVAGGNAIASWVARVDDWAVRNTQDVDVLIRRTDLQSVERALTSAGFVRWHSAGMEMFLDGPTAGARDAVHLLFAEEKVRPDYLHPAAGVNDVVRASQFFVLSLEPLVRMKLTAYRDKDRTHLRDLIDVGLVDRSWVERLPSDLALRLQQLLDTPDG
jgi:hypothetical protein